MAKDTNCMVRCIIGPHHRKYIAIDNNGRSLTVYESDVYRVLMSKEGSIVMNKLNNTVYRNVKIAYHHIINRMHQEASCSGRAQSSTDSMDSQEPLG